jgi:D-sedoheptulose 7-phosphate isomerase
MSLTPAQQKQRIDNHFADSAKTIELTLETCKESIIKAADLISATFRSGGKLLLAGNGGSAADCQHMAAEFVSRLTKELERPGLPAIALTTDTSFLTAFSNDINFDGVFARQVQALSKPGDTLLGISTSGNSRNVLQAVELAQKLGVQSVGLCGKGGKIADLATVSIRVPSINTQHIQECHLCIEHIICELVEQALFGQG